MSDSTSLQGSSCNDTTTEHAEHVNQLASLARELAAGDLVRAMYMVPTLEQLLWWAGVSDSDPLWQSCAAMRVAVTWRNEQLFRCELEAFEALARQL